MTLDRTPPTAEPAPLSPRRLRAPTLRSRLMLEVSSHIVGEADWAAKQALISLRVQGADDWQYRLMASDSPRTIPEVVAGAIDVGIVNPATAILPTLRREGLPLDSLASIATVPSYDQVGLAVHERFGVRTILELAEARPPISVSLRSQRDHAIHRFIEDIFEAAGIALGDIEAWGGRLDYDDGLPHFPIRRARFENRDVDAMFDEGIYNWTGLATEAGMTFLRIDDEVLDRLEERGYRTAFLTRARFPELSEDIPTIDFSGFMIYARADAPDELIRAVCTALDERSDAIAWQGGDELPLPYMVSDAVDAPLAVPLHPAAEAYWRERGMRP